MLKTLKSNQQGFISVVALGIFALMTLAGLNLYQANLNMVEDIQAENNWYHAQDLAFSGKEFLLYNVNFFEYGFNQKITCGYGKYAKDGENYDVCEDMKVVATVSNTLPNADAKLTMEIKGRHDKTDQFKGNCGLDKKDCYTIPLPGTGTAGDRCKLYKPELNDINKKVDNQGKISPNGLISQLDYACNWNKLTFGSSATDRTAIPLYYDSGEYEKGEKGIISPFNIDENNGFPINQDFVLRLRTPCLPFAEKGKDPQPGETRERKGKNPDPTICDDKERYKLAEKEDNGINDIVVQWQIVGTCKDGEKEEEQCGLIPYEGKPINGIPDPTNSKFTETLINNNPNPKNIVLQKISQGLNTNTFPQKETPIMEKKEGYYATPLLPIMKKPTLTLMLSNKLLTYKKMNIPYLEYQLLTDNSVGSPEIRLTAEAIFNNSGFIEKVIQKVKRPLVDFAIQN